MLPPTSGRGIPGYPASSSAAAAYNNAYTNTLSVAASQAASLGIPAASKAIIRKKSISIQNYENIKFPLDHEVLYLF